MRRLWPTGGCCAMEKKSYLKFAREQNLEGVFLEHDTVWNCGRSPQIPGSCLRGGRKVEGIWDGY